MPPLPVKRHSVLGEDELLAPGFEEAVKIFFWAARSPSFAQNENVNVFLLPEDEKVLFK